MTIRLSGALAVMLTLVPLAPAAAQSAAIDIPYERHVLPNGLTLIIHEDHKAPIVAVNVWYHVGSKNERPRRTGFAHLFEHLMFNGSENWNKEFFEPLQQVGATDLNGTTNEDRTNYFENVPVNALDRALWLESDRMGHLLGVITQEKLDEQRGVVQNEKRQNENEPYGRVWEFLNPKLYPANHPYSWSAIGSMEDLNAAKLDDVKEWFQTYYGAANAVLVIAGDVKPADVKAKVEKYFGDIPSGPPVERQEAWIAKRTGSQRGWMQDRVPQAKLYKIWNVPQWGSAEGENLVLLGQVLSGGKSSRLFKRLVYDDQIATDVVAYADLQEIGGKFVIEASARPGGDLSKVERAVNEEMARLPRGRPHGGRAPTGQDPVSSLAGTRHGAHRRVRRQVRPPCPGPGLGRPRRLLQDAAPARPGGDGHRAPGHGQALAVGRRVHPRGRPLRRVPDRCRRRRPVEAAGERSAAGDEVPGARARDAIQRAQDRAGGAAVHSPGAARPGAGRRLRGRPARRARHRQPRDVDAGRGDPRAYVTPDQRRARGPRRQSVYRIAARRVGRFARGVEGQARRRPSPSTRT